jgi:predicted ATPase/class 3 adenylate cyclase
MPTTPTGTVTFLFTDIEGSTQLARQYPQIWESLRKRHHAILHGAITANNGYVFQIVADAFSAAFHTAGDAVRAAIKSQLDLQAENWEETPIRVRMGIHTGKAEVQPEGLYHGYLTLSHVQRLMSAGHGGQVLLSFTTQQLVQDELPEDVYLRDLGGYRLKDFDRAEHIFQVVVPDFQKEFPPLRALDVVPNNLPIQLTSFVGRNKEISQIKKRLEQYRLLTLNGSGGVGKSRLSTQVASELLTHYPDGVWLAELAPITDPSLVTQTVCAALDVTPQGDTPALNVLMDYLQPKKTLLVVDNCEHLLDACEQLCEALLHACPDLRIIASSREALGIEGESAYRVPSLSLPDSHGGLQAVEESEAVKLFIERANALLPDFELTEFNAPVITQICQRLDGIALAIELAVSRVKILKVEQIAARLDDAFRLLTGGSRTALPRHQTLRGTIDWSYNLLADEEQTALRRFSVFVGGWTLEAAEVVCDKPDMLDLLTHLVDKSLVVVDREHGDEARYYFLETIRQYLREKLFESGEVEQIRDRHLDYFLKLAQKAEPELFGRGQIEWMQKLEDEHENMRAALEWSLQGNIIAGQELAGALWWSWYLNGHLSEGYEWIEKMLGASSGDETLIRAKLLSAEGWFAQRMWDQEVARKLSDESVALFRKLGNEIGTAFSLCVLGIISATLSSDYEQSTQYIRTSLDIFKRAGNQWGVSSALRELGFAVDLQGDFIQAQKFYEQSLLICKEIGDQAGMAHSLFIMGESIACQGNPTHAMKLYEEALEFAKAVRSKPTTANIVTGMGHVASYSGDYQGGRQLLEEAMEIHRKMGDRAGVGRALRYLAWTARLQGDYFKARSLYLECLQLLQRMQNKEGIIATLIHIGNLLLVQGSPEKFVRMLGVFERAYPEGVKTSLPFFQIETEKFIKNARAALGDEAYTAAYEAGQQMSIDEAVAYALKELQQ